MFTNHGSISILFDEDPTWKPTHTLLFFHCPLDYCHFPGYYRSKAYKGLFVSDRFNTPHTSSEAETNIKTTDNTCFLIIHYIIKDTPLKMAETRQYVMRNIPFYSFFNLNLLEIKLKLIYLCTRKRVINKQKESNYEKVFDDFSSSICCCNER